MIYSAACCMLGYALYSMLSCVWVRRVDWTNEYINGDLHGRAQIEALYSRSRFPVAISCCSLKVQRHSSTSGSSQPRCKIRIYVLPSYLLPKDTTSESNNGHGWVLPPPPRHILFPPPVDRRDCVSTTSCGVFLSSSGHYIKKRLPVSICCLQLLLLLVLLQYRFSVELVP